MNTDPTGFLKQIQHAARAKQPVLSMEKIATELTTRVAQTGLPNHASALLQVAGYITEALQHTPIEPPETNDRALLTAFKAAGVASAFNAELREPAESVTEKAYTLMSDAMRAEARSGSLPMMSSGRPRPKLAPDKAESGFAAQEKAKTQRPPADPSDLPNTAEQKIADIIRTLKEKLQGRTGPA